MNGSKTCSIVADADPRWYVAVARSSGAAYRLSGSDESEVEFDRMVTDAHLWVEDAMAAQSLVELYLTLRFGPDDVEYGPHHIIVGSSLDLKHSVESDFYSCYDDAKAPKVFEAWWSGFSGLKRAPELKTKAEKVEGGFTVVVKTLEKISYRLPEFMLLTKRPILQERSFRVSSNGQISGEYVESIFPR